MAGDRRNDGSGAAYVPELTMLPSPLVLPANLDALLRLLSNGLEYQVPVGGATTACTATETHDLRLWVTGTYSGRSLRLLKCAHCEAVEVRDVSLDAAIGSTRLSRRPLNRLLGWYTGKRPSGRTYAARSRASSSGQ